MAGETELTRVHSRIDDLYKVTSNTKDEMTREITGVRLEVTEIKTILMERPRHEEGKCKVLVEHIEGHDAETCSTLRAHIAKETESAEKKEYFLADAAVRLIIPIITAIGAFSIAWYFHP